jgi:hypothetical protein
MVGFSSQRVSPLRNKRHSEIDSSEATTMKALFLPIRTSVDGSSKRVLGPMREGAEAQIAKQTVIKN